MEVIYTGLHQTPEQIAETVIQEDADAVGLSILSGAHMTLVPKVVELLDAQGVDDVLVTVGGTIPAEDIPELKKLGVAAVFTPGAGTDEIVDFIREGAEERHDGELARSRHARRGHRMGVDEAHMLDTLTAATIDRLIDWSVNQITQPKEAELEDLRPGQGGSGRRRPEAHRLRARCGWTAAARKTSTPSTPMRSRPPCRSRRAARSRSRKSSR